MRHQSTNRKSTLQARISAVTVETARRPLRSAPPPKTEPAKATPSEPPSPLLEMVRADPIVIAATQRVRDAQRARKEAHKRVAKAQRALDEAHDTPDMAARDAAELAWTAEIRRLGDTCRDYHLARADRYEALVAARQRVRAQLSASEVAP